MNKKHNKTNNKTNIINKNTNTLPQPHTNNTILTNFTHYKPNFPYRYT